MVDDDVTYVDRTLRGDKRAFESLVEKYQKLVFNLAYNMTRNRDDAADVTQSVFLKVYEKLYSFNRKFKFFSWMYRIALNEALNVVQKQDRTKTLDEEIASDARSPDGGLAVEDQTRSIQDAVLELEANYRVVIVLRHFQDLSYEDIATVLEIPEKTVKSRLFTARALLRTICLRRGIIE